MNNALNQLQPYPFEKLRALLGSVQPNTDKRPIALSIGEPKHRSPDFVAKALADNLDQMAVRCELLPGVPLAAAAACAAELRHHLKAMTGVNAQEVVGAPDSIERTLVGKARRVVDKRPRG